MVNLPLRDSNGNAVPGPLGQPNPGGGPVLIRNTAFAASPDANVSRFQTWTIESNNLPAGTRGFWVSGGHAAPDYYLYASDTGGFGLYKRNRTNGSWQRLSVSNLLVGGSTYGPAFVNPYDSTKLFVLTSGGIKVSRDGGVSFQDDRVLTDLLTGSGRFPLTGAFLTNENNVVQPSVRGNVTATLAHMAFYRDAPRKAVAASPFTGIFYTTGDGAWRDVGGALPLPRTPVSDVGIDCHAVYATMEGRSVVRLSGATAPSGSCATPVIIPAGGGTFAGTTKGGSVLSSSCGSSGNAPEAVFQWTPTASGQATIQTCGGSTDYDTVLSIRNGACATGAELAGGCNDDACVNALGLGRASSIKPTVTAGQTYFIVVEGYNGDRGDFTLTVTAPGGCG